MLTATERGDLIERMLPVAAGLVCIVHGDGDARDVAAQTDHLDRTECVGLIVALASLVNPDRPLSDALAYVTWDEHGQPVATEPAPPTERVADIAEQRLVPVDTDQLIAEERRRTARALHHNHGMSHKAIARRLDVHPRTILRWLNGAPATTKHTVMEGAAR
ncbi:MAG: helix-turn-helix domain-containing protein [Streptomyces sp.]|nr:helix-turn-helix domain-containing protein [Streptomyces sp.]NUS24384.1 helix-turn-helix domain-containing protein [Streptomyces sp.]